MILESRKYCLHDASLNNICVGKSGIELIFEKGIYVLTQEGKEDTLTDKCELKIDINNFYSENVLQHLQIIRQYKRKIKEISIWELKEMLLKDNFVVYDSFWSDFSKGLIIKGNVNKFFVELNITEIKTIEYLFK